MMIRFLHILLFILAGIAGTDTAITQSVSNQFDIGEKIEHQILPPVLIDGEDPAKISLAERMEQLAIPGVSIAVVHEGEIIWAEGYGVIKQGSDQSVTTSTRFQAASLSKPVTATAVLSFVENGQAELDEDVNNYFESWKIPNNEFTGQQPVTLRRLLNHSAGINIHGFRGYPSDLEKIPGLQDILEGTGSANTDAVSVHFTPGTRWQYSGGGYIIIQQILEDLTGNPFPLLMKESLLDKLEMSDSTFELLLPAESVEQAATGHVRGNFPIPTGWHLYPEQAAAGLWTTPVDLAAWMIEVQLAFADDESRILSFRTAEKMLASGLGDWGLGLQINGNDHTLNFNHSGANEGYRSYLMAFAREQHGIVIMTNSDHGSMLFPEIVRTVAYYLDWPDYQPSSREIATVKANKLETYSGVYELETGIPLEITPGDNELFVTIPGEVNARFLPVSDTEFFDVATDVKIEFFPASSGNVHELKLIIEHYELSGYRID